MLAVIKVYLFIIRDVAQSGSVHAWGAWGRRFKSCHPDFKGLLYIYSMVDNKKLISKKKPFFNISEKLEDFLKTHDRWIDDVISYDHLLRFSDSINLYDKKNNKININLEDEIINKTLVK